MSTGTPCSGLLIGNGASMAVWHDFYYDSLFDKAKSVAEKPLSQTELSVFEALGTRNFEHVLSALKTASKVNKALAINSASPRKRRYYAIKEALINSTQDVHILAPGGQKPWHAGTVNWRATPAVFSPTTTASARFVQLRAG